MVSSPPASVNRLPQTFFSDDENVNLLNNTRGNYSHDDLISHNRNEFSTPSDIHSNIRDFKAVTVPRKTSALVLVYIVIWLTYFVEGILSATTGILTPYVTSTFSQHSLTPTVGILSSVIGGVTNLTLAKVLDIFGRAHGLLFCITLATTGLIMMSTCNSLQGYAAAQVFQTIGNNGILYSLTVLVADTSSMRNRGLVQAIVSSPNLITSWLSGPISSKFMNGPVVCAIAIGALIHLTGRFKPVCIYVGIPLSLLGLGSMAYYTKSESGVGNIIMSQIFISVAAGIIMVCDEVAILAAASDHDAAVCLAVLGLFGNIGGAIGLTIASTIWQNIFLRKLMEFVPIEELPNVANIYADLSTQLSYPIGSETRLAIQHAYEDTQGNLLIIAMVVWAGGFVAVAMWRNINVIDVN
ncbi:hypothetical protein GGI35DRAFT_487076 [Trichoderma velutinum]